MVHQPRLVVQDADERQRRRTARILDAIRAEIESRRNAIDMDENVRSVTISVKMRQGSNEVRAVVVNVESEKTLSN